MSDDLEKPRRGPGRPRVPLLENPLTRRLLQQDVAHGGVSQVELSRKYGVTPASISDFIERHAHTIQQIRDDVEDKFAGIAIAKKAARLEAYQELLEKCLVPVPKMAGGEYVRDVAEDGTPGEVVYEIDAGVAVKVLRQVAEELGELPNRVTLGGEVGIKTDYRINGLDPEALK